MSRIKFLLNKLAAMALHSKYICYTLFTPQGVIATIVLLIVIIYLGVFLVNTFYIQAIGSEVGIYGGYQIVINDFLMFSNAYLFTPCIKLLSDKPIDNDFNSLNINMEEEEITGLGKDLPTDLNEITHYHPPLTMDKNSLTPIITVGVGENVMYYFIRNDSLLVKEGLLNELFRTLLTEESFLNFGGGVKAIALYSLEPTKDPMLETLKDADVVPFHTLFPVFNTWEPQDYSRLALSTNYLLDYLDLDYQSRFLLVRLRKVKLGNFDSMEIL